MFKGLIQMILVMLLVSACAHRGAPRVNCTGPLRPINASSRTQAPVSTEPAPLTPAPTETPP
jgi:hypothetical protein